MRPAPGALFNIEWSGDALERLSELHDARGMIDIWIEDAVKECRRGETVRNENSGHESVTVIPVSWQRIGDALGISRAAAWERWHDLD